MAEATDDKSVKIWKCGGCREINTITSKTCRHCGTERQYCEVSGSSSSSKNSETIPPAQNTSIMTVETPPVSEIPINYDDYSVCTNCHTVNLRSDNSCRKCSSRTLQSINEASGTTGCFGATSLILVIVGIVLVFTGAGIPVSIVLFIIAYSINKNAQNKIDAKKNRFQEDALVLFRSLAKSQRAQAETAKETGLLNMQSGNFQSAVKYLEQAYQLGKSDLQTKYALATSYYNSNDYAAAIPLYEELLSLSDCPSDVRELLARAYMKQGVESEEQITHLLSVRAIAGQKLKDLITLALASVFRLSHRSDEDAYSVLSDAHTLEPMNPDHVEALANWLQDHQKAAEVVAICQQLSPEQHSKESIRPYTRALDMLGDMSEQAIAVYERYLNFEPADNDICMRLALAYVRKRDLQAAIRVYKNGLTLLPDDVRIRYHLALTYMMVEQVEDAMAELQGLMRQENFSTYKTREDIFRLLGRCFVKKGMLNAAFKQYQQADRSIDTLDLLYDLGHAFESQGDTVNARGCWEEIYSTDVRYKDIAQKLGSVG